MAEVIAGQPTNEFYSKNLKRMMGAAHHAALTGNNVAATQEWALQSTLSPANQVEMRRLLARNPSWSYKPKELQDAAA